MFRSISIVLLYLQVFSHTILAQQSSSVSFALKQNTHKPNCLIPDSLLSHRPAIIIPKVAPHLSAFSLGRLAIQAAVQKRYAVALRIFHTNHINPWSGVKSPYNTFKDTALDSLYILITNQTHQNKTSYSLPKSSSPVKIRKFLRAFHDHKKAIGYGLYIHVKQPIPGKRKRFKWFAGVGHSFITLIKYNQDGTHISKTYGFYPRKHFILEATPLLPWAPSNFKNDSLHNWDESLGTIITSQQFHKIIRLSRKFSKQTYHLSHTNCTDFALAVAQLCGIHIYQTSGNWPLGAGNDPGDTGQSLLEKKYNSQNKESNFLIINKRLSEINKSASLSPVLNNIQNER